MGLQAMVITRLAVAKPAGAGFADPMKLLFGLLKLAVAAVALFWGGGLLLFRFVDPPATPLMLIRTVERGQSVRYRPLPLSAVAPALGRSVIASEDSRFCLHRGIDLDAVQDALDDYEETGRLRGASTIPMQVARNLFLWPGGGFLRKGLEAPLALALDAFWPKRRILELYLSIAEMGPGLFGAGAAAEAHFGVPAARLSETQAARLAAILPSPNRWNPVQPTAYIERRTGIIRGRTGQLSQAQLACIN
jgi:monofunctional biosynthetic peptidoglycan transglycosylase